MRLAGSAGATDQIAKEILSRWPGKVLSAEEAERRWCNLREFSWAKNGELVKIPLNPNVLPELSRALGAFKDIEMQVSGGGAVAYASWSDESQAAAMNELLCLLKLPAMALQGKGPLWYGPRDVTKIAQAVKQALDPDNRFPPLDQ
jgi:hypothetical protein